jgi:hypothetical protein
MKKIIVFILILFSGCTSESPKIKSLIDKWNKANNDKNISLLKEVYAEEVNYYTNKTSKAYCIEDQTKFFKKNPDSYQSIHGDVQYESINSNEIKASFVKRVTIKNKTKDYPSYLIFKRIKNDYKISAEGEIGNIAQNNSAIEKSERELPEPKGEIIEGDFDGDGRKEQIAEYLIDPKSKKIVDIKEWADNGLDGISQLRCSNNAIRNYEIEGRSIGLLYFGNKGDLNGDGADDIFFVKDQMQSRIHGANILSYKNGKWEIILSFGIDIFYKKNPFITKSTKANTVIIYEFDMREEGEDVKRREVTF